MHSGFSNGTWLKLIGIYVVNTISFMCSIVNLSLMGVIFSRQNISVMRYSGYGRNSS